VGITLSTNGVLVVEHSEIISRNNQAICPAKNAGIKVGDLIQSFDGKKISTVDQLQAAISSSSKSKIPIEICRNGKILNLFIEPVTSQKDNTSKIGVWVKDTASGIGTLTYYDPENNFFAALGHGICDPNTEEVISIQTGFISNSAIVSVEKGQKGIPGELNGIIKKDESALGEIVKNTTSGIYGKLNTTPKEIGSLNAVQTATRNEVKLGKVKIVANITDNKIEEFDAEIIKLLPKTLSYQKGFVIQITDKTLIDKTGGIVQGMSGSPIIQNGKLVGAVTHVFVNDPTRGYGIFIENMLAEAEKIK
jgi:stage IV sporulation protein B